MSDPTDLRIPADLLPADGRFGSGPSKVRQQAVEALAQAAPRLLGTSHRKPAVKAQVARVREGLAAFFDLPGDWEVVLSNGGASAFWDVATFGLIDRRSAHAVLGEFSSKFAKVASAAPFLDAPHTVAADPGTRPALTAVEGVDAYALVHCETSTGVAMEVARPDGVDEGALVLVDGTSAAAGLAWSPRECDAYYFSPQKAFGSEGGLWFALLSPAAQERNDRLAGSDRWVPASLDLAAVRENSAKDQTPNTPSISTLYLMGEQLDWLLARGGFEVAVKDCRDKAERIYTWAESRDWAQPFVADPAARSHVVCTIDLDGAVPADGVNAALRANGVVDTDAYRKLGRNQLRIATFPAVTAEDVAALTACIDWVVDRLPDTP